MAIVAFFGESFRLRECLKDRRAKERSKEIEITKVSRIP